MQTEDPMNTTVASIPFNIKLEIVICLLNNEISNMIPQIIANSDLNSKIEAAENQTNKLCFPFNQ